MFSWSGIEKSMAIVLSVVIIGANCLFAVSLVYTVAGVQHCYTKIPKQNFTRMLSTLPSMEGKGGKNMKFSSEGSNGNAPCP